MACILIDKSKGQTHTGLGGPAVDCANQMNNLLGMWHGIEPNTNAGMMYNATFELPLRLMLVKCSTMASSSLDSLLIA